jgi:hypothetical protein
MSFNRLMYDHCEGKKRLDQSVGPGNYKTNTPVLCGNCLQTDPHIQPNRTGVSLNSGVNWRFYAGPIDVESDLFNLNRVASRCPKNKYQPMGGACKCTNQGQPRGAGVISECSPQENFSNKQARFRTQGQRCNDNNLVSVPECYFGTEDTRLSNPPSSLRGTGINRFDPLCFDPQEKIFFPGDYHVSTRLVFRDNHRPCIPSLETISAKPLPDAEPLPCAETQKTCAAFAKPMFQYDVCG